MFGLNCLQIAGSVAALLYWEIDLTKQLATKNALICWSCLIPAHFLALGLLLVFYQYCHVWKKEGVVVGYAYQKSTNNALCRSCGNSYQKSENNDKEQQRFKGYWVTHQKTTSEEGDRFPVHLR